MTRETDSASTPTTPDRARRSNAQRLERERAADALDVDPADGDEDRTDGDGSAVELDAAADRCASCGATIGPWERRLSWIVREDGTTLETHYCSEACLPDDAAGAGTGSESSAERTDSATGPRDWSYCR